jgi:hypothetical protein
VKPPAVARVKLIGTTMSEPISRRPATDIRLPYTAHCNKCGGSLTVCMAEIEGEGWNPIQWLRRIPPLSELEGEKRDEEITA